MQNSPDRRFCRHCGSWLVTPVTVPPAPPEALRSRLRKHWWGGGGPYTGRLSAATVAFRVLIGIVVVAVLALVLGLAGLNPVRGVTDLVGGVLGSGRVEGVTAAAQPADALPGHPAAWVVDDIRGRGYATRWVAASEGDPDAACAPGGAPAPEATASTLVLTLPELTDVRQIGFEAGLPADDPDRGARWRPRTLELRWSGGGCQVVQLADVPGLQRFGVDQGMVDDVTVTVVAGYPPAVDGSDRLDIGEITFWRR